MSQELSNKHDLYPCVLNRVEASAAQLDVAAYIQDLRICIRTKDTFSAYIVSANSSVIQVILSNDQSESDAFLVSLSSTGFVTSTDSRLVSNNSYVQFTHPYSDSIDVVSCHIPILSQCLLYIPQGLQIQCRYGVPEQTAKSIDYTEQINSYKFTSSIDFLSGYNFQPFGITGGVSLSAGIALGSGTIPAKVIADVVGTQYTQGRVLQIKGLRSINGQTKDVQIITQGKVGLRQSLTGNNTLTITLFKIKQGGEDASQT